MGWTDVLQVDLGSLKDDRHSPTGSGLVEHVESGVGVRNGAAVLRVYVRDHSFAQLQPGRTCADELDVGPSESAIRHSHLRIIE